MCSYVYLYFRYGDISRVTSPAVGRHIPIVLCGNKVTLCPTILALPHPLRPQVDCVREREVSPREISYHRKKNLQYYEMSAKSMYNFDKPFLWLAKKVCTRSLRTTTPSPCSMFRILTRPPPIFSTAAKL